MAVVDRVETESMEPVHWLLVGLATVTGLIHLGLGLAAPTTPVGAASVLAGIGYGVGIGLVLMDRMRLVVYAVAIPYVGAQIVLWYLIQQPDSLAAVGPAAMVDKPVQAVLIGLCLYLLVREWS